MKPDSTRHIVVKSLFSADEFKKFEAACRAGDVPQSRILRDLANQWSGWMHRTARAPRRERPRAGQNMAMSLPGRRGGAPIPLRL